MTDSKPFHTGAYYRIKEKRSFQKKNFKDKNILKRDLPHRNESPRKVPKSKEKDDETTNFTSNMYYYFINDASVIDKMHLKQSDQISSTLDKGKSDEDLNYDSLDYLTQVEIKEIKNNYQDYSFGDYLMVFPNPDAMKKNRPVSFREALAVYEALTTKSQNMNKEMKAKEKQIFIQAFRSLDDYVKEGEGEESEEEDFDDDDGPLKGKKSKQSIFSALFGKKKKNGKEKRKTTQGFLSRKKGETNEESEREENTAENSERKINKGNETLDDKEEQLLKKRDLNNEDIEMLKFLYKKMKRMKTVRKKFCNGGFLERKFSEGKDAAYDYICRNQPAKDFLTLIRNVILAKLTMLCKIHVRQFLCSTGKDILVVIKCDEEVLKKHAEYIEMSKQMELGACDLMSLEPVDRRLRPLRIKNFMKMEEEEYTEFVEERRKKRGHSKLKKNFKETSLQNLKENDRFFSECLKDCKRAKLQETCKGIYEAIMNLEESNLRNLLISKNERVNKYLKILVKDYRIDVPDTNTDIQNDCEISRQEWLAYYIYLCYLDKYFDAVMRKYKDNKFIKENILFLLKLIVRKAVGDSNEIHDMFHKVNFFLKLLGLHSRKSLLKTIWNYLKLDPTPPFSKFFLSENGKEQKREEKKQISPELRKNDQNKTILKSGKSPEGRKSKAKQEIEEGSSPNKIKEKPKAEKTQKNLWRTYEINEFGERSIFLNMEKMKIINDIILKNFNMVFLMKNLYVDSYFPLHNYYELNLKKYHEFFRRLELEKLVVPKTQSKEYEELYKLSLELADEAEITDFNSDGSCLINETKFNSRYPWFISIETMRNYFGEKIAIYFSFLSFYTLEMTPMAILGLLAQILIYAEVQTDAVKLSFSILIIVWSTIFIEMWKRRQGMFAVKFGQMDFQEEESERPDFIGEYNRSIINDDYNLTYFNSGQKKLRMFFSFFVSLLLIGCVIFCVYGIFELKSQAYCYELVDGQCIEIPQNNLVQVLLTLLNTIQIVIFNQIYGRVALKLNDYENHKLFSSYENSLVLKIFFFNFVNTFFSLVFVAFFDTVFPRLNLCKTQSSCYESLSRQMMIIFLTFYASNVGEVVTPLSKLWINKFLAKKTDSKQTSNKYVLFNIDQEIETDYLKSNYFPSLEIDGTVADYMEMAMQFGFLNLFGMSFPLAFTLAYINDIAEIQVDKMKLLDSLRRPIPKGAANIGTWLVILDLISFLAIFSNTGIIILTAGVASKSSISTLFLFVVLLLIFLGLKYVIRFLIPDTPQKANIVIQRHNYVIEKCNRELQIKKNVKYIPCKGSTYIENVVALTRENEGTVSLNASEKETIKLQEINIEKQKRN